jgi:hypothetical protein
MRPPRLDLDTRSLALFRILLGLYFVAETLYGRLRYDRYDLAWYTSDPQHDNDSFVVRSYLHAEDTPHGSPLHQVWFYRGSVTVQCVLFAVTAVVAALFALGFCCNGPLKVLLWALVTAQTNRNMHVHNGSDTYGRHLLFWCCFLPLEHAWSVDAFLKRRQQGRVARLDSAANRKSSTTSANTFPSAVAATSSTTTTTVVVATLPAYAMALQIVLVYVGTVLSFTTSWNNIYSSLLMLVKHGTWQQHAPHQWSSSALYYLLSTSFAVQDAWLVSILQRHVWADETITLVAMLVGTICPIVTWYIGPQWRLHSVAPLIALHAAAMWQCLPPWHWHCLALVSHVVWIPSHVWHHHLLSRFGTARHSRSGAALRDVALRKKTDAQTLNDDNGANTTSQRQLHVFRRLPNQSGGISKGLQMFFLSYMLYNFAGEQGWIPKHDHGDIGEGLRLSQHWGMYGTSLSTTAHATRLTGILPSDPHNQQDKPRRMDLLHFIASRGEIQLEPASRHVASTAMLDMSRRYPSVRWERALYEWSLLSYTHPDYGSRLGKHFARALCSLVNQDLFERNRHDNLVAIEVVFSHWTVNPPGSLQRYAMQPAAVDTIISVPCLPFPSLRLADAPSAAT